MSNPPEATWFDLLLAKSTAIELGQLANMRPFQGPLGVLSPLAALRWRLIRGSFK